MFGGIGVLEVVAILLLLLLLFGAKRIPMIARGLGEGIRNFKSGFQERERLGEGEDEEAESDDPRG